MPFAFLTGVFNLHIVVRDLHIRPASGTSKGLRRIAIYIIYYYYDYHDHYDNYCYCHCHCYYYYYNYNYNNNNNKYRETQVSHTSHRTAPLQSHSIFTDPFVFISCASKRLHPSGWPYEIALG